ncbi:MAG: TIR domain-containing protein [Desulfomonile tiedjei]|nr:TIR domain-containing protein [Desulfomonile tiedjei]
MKAPKLFISYSWSSPEHEKWVLDLATELREAGVDAMLDKWDLREGHDAVAFMEKMVIDPEIKKVIMICDKVYAEKADGRAGGVGTETQIISREVYEKQDQNKFVAIIREKDPDGKPFCPTYYKSHIYIDFSEDGRRAESSERLLRWIFEKPSHVKPELGAMPSYLSEGKHISLGTTAAFTRCIDAIKNHKTNALGAFDDFCSLFVSGMKRFSLSEADKEFDEALIENISEFIPYRNQVIQLIIAVARYSSTEEFITKIHRLLESLLPYMSVQVKAQRWRGKSPENFRFLIHELFLYALAILLKHERFDQAKFLLAQRYYVPGESDYGRPVMASFTLFRSHLDSLAERNRRLGGRRLSIRADLLKERCSGTGIDWNHVMQADLVAFIRAEVEEGSGRWFPETLLYAHDFTGPFELFARSVSTAYFDRIAKLLAVNTPADLERLWKDDQGHPRHLPRWQHEGFRPETLTGYDRLATRP